MINPNEGEPCDTRRRLLNVALVLFGQVGFKGASTRAIAAEAGTMMSSITYHFGSKRGLYLATAEHVARSMQTWMVSAVESAASTCSAERNPGAARGALHFVLNRAVEVLNAEKTRDVSRFIFKEQAEASEAFALIYDEAMRPMFDGLVSIFLAATDHCVPEGEARVRCTALFGQILVFKVSRASVLRTNGWSEIGPHELSMIKRVIGSHLDAILDLILNANAR